MIDSVKYMTLSSATIPNTTVQTVSISSPSNSVKYLAYLFQFSQDDFIAIRPLNIGNVECWSNSKKVDEIIRDKLIATIEVVNGKIILGIDAKVDSKMINIGSKIFVESEEMQHEIGVIDEIYTFTKNVTDQVNTSKKVSAYRVFFEKFVKKSLGSFAISKFFSPLICCGIYQGLDKVEQGFGQSSKMAASDGDWFEGDLQKVSSVTGRAKLTLPTGEIQEGFFKRGVMYKGRFSFPNGDLLFGKLEKRRFSGVGKYTVSSRHVMHLNGVIYEGTWKKERFIKGKVTWPDGYWEHGTFHGKGKRVTQSEMILQGTFENGIFVKGKKIWSDGYWEEGTFHGEGNQTTQNGVILEGTWVKGIFVKGKRTRFKGDFEEVSNYLYDTIEEGVFENEKLIQGKRISLFLCMRERHNIEEGFFENGKLVKGKTTMYNVEWGGWSQKIDIVLEGFFKDGKLLQGKKSWSNGEWREGVFEGKGQLIGSDGVISEGIFREGILVQGKMVSKVRNQTFMDWFKLREEQEKVEEGIFTSCNSIFETSKLLFGKRTFLNKGIIEKVEEGIFQRGRLVHEQQIKLSELLEDKFFDKEQIQLESTEASEISDCVKIIQRKMVWPNGYWREGTFEGKGLQVDKDGNTFEGFFKGGQLIQGKITPIDGISVAESGEKKYLINTGAYEFSLGISLHMIPLSSIYNNCFCKNQWNFSQNELILDFQGHDDVLLFYIRKACIHRMNLEQKISDFIRGKNGLSEIAINGYNALYVLMIAKIIDSLARRQGILTPRMKRSTYLIRQAVLKKVPNEVSTCQVFTNSLNPADYDSLEYLVNSQNWVDERVAAQTKLIIDYNILSRTLSARMSNVVVALRGNTGVGKSHLIQESLKHYFLPKYLRESLHEHDDFVHGVLNPDRFKAILKKIDGSSLLNGQVHLEGRLIFDRLLEILTKHPSAILGAVIDTRLLTLEDFRSVLAFSQSRNSRLEVIDVEAPIWYSILSVLNRELFGKDPCVPFEVIKDGFIKARANRREFIHASTHKRVNYTLFQLAPTGDYIPMMRKGESDDCPLFLSSNIEECFRVPSEDEMDEIANTVITEELIQSLEMPRNKKVLEQWIGHTVKDALELHLKKELPSS